MSSLNFAICFRALGIGTEDQRLAVIFKMLDFDEDSLINREDLRVLLTHTIGNPKLKT